MSGSLIINFISPKGYGNIFPHVNSHSHVRGGVCLSVCLSVVRGRTPSKRLNQSWRKLVYRYRIGLWVKWRYFHSNRITDGSKTADGSFPHWLCFTDSIWYDFGITSFIFLGFKISAINYWLLLIFTLMQQFEFHWRYCTRRGDSDENSLSTYVRDNASTLRFCFNCTHKVSALYTTSLFEDHVVDWGLKLSICLFIKVLIFSNAHFIVGAEISVGSIWNQDDDED